MLAMLPTSAGSHARMHKLYMSVRISFFGLAHGSSLRGPPRETIRIRYMYQRPVRLRLGSRAAARVGVIPAIQISLGRKLFGQLKEAAQPGTFPEDAHSKKTATAVIGRRAAERRRTLQQFRSRADAYCLG